MRFASLTAPQVDWGRGWCQPLTATPPSGRPTALPIAESLTAGLSLPGLWGWQRMVLAVALERELGRWAYRTVVCIVSRQNGKTVMVALRALIGLMLGEKVLYSMHDRQKGREKWLEAAELLEAHFGNEVRVVRRLGDEHVRHLKSGGVFKLVTPTSAGARSFTADCAIVDEAAFIAHDFVAALRPTMVTRPSAQIWMISSAGTERSIDLARARQTATAHLLRDPVDRTACIFEWGAAADSDWASEKTWHEAVPTLGQPGGAVLESMRDDFDTMELEEFAREYLGVWTGNPLDAPIGGSIWEACQTDELPNMSRLIAAVDTDPQQRWASISAAGWTPDKITGVSLVAHRDGDAWVQPTLEEFYRRHRPIMLVTDARNPAGQLAARWKARGRRVHKTNSEEMSQACAGFVTLLRQKDVLIERDDTLTAAALGARRRFVSEGWAFDRHEGSDTPISPVVSAALAAFRRDAFPHHPGAVLYKPPIDELDVSRETVTTLDRLLGM